MAARNANRTGFSHSTLRRPAVTTVKKYVPPDTRLRR
jgi:hypothetical protein